MNKTTIRNLIQADIITMNGGKNNLRFTMILMLVIFGSMGFLLSPLMGLYCPLMLSGFFVPMLFQNEMKYHSEKMFSLIPISRKELVTSRFLLTIGLYTVCDLIFYLLMLLSLNLKLYRKITDTIDIIGYIVKKSEGSFTELGFLNLCYFAAFAIGLIVSANALRMYFRDGELFAAAFSITTKTKKMPLKNYIPAILIILAIFIFFLIITGIIPIGTAMLVILQLFIQLAEAANGFLLGAMLTAIAVMEAGYHYICTVLEYDQKDL